MKASANQVKRTQERIGAEQCCRRSMLRFLAGCSMLRSALTLVVPVAGSASWWMSAVLIVPGALLCLVLAWLMRRAGVSSLTDLAGRTLGKAGCRMISVALGAALMLDGAVTLTAFVSLLIDVIGALGTPFVMAAITCGVMLPCLRGDGLPRAIRLILPMLLLGEIAVLIDLLGKAHTDGLFPLMGGGVAELWTVPERCAGLSWPLLLLADEPDVRSNRCVLMNVALPSGISLGLILLLNLSVPHEVLHSYTRLADTMGHLCVWLGQGVRTLSLVLAMQAFFLLLASETREAALLLSASGNREAAWLPAILAAGLALTQLIPSADLMRVLPSVHAWLLLPFAALTAAMGVGLRLRKGKA